MENLETVKKIPVIFVSVHFILVVMFSIVILIWLKYNDEAGMAWAVFNVLDWPVSIIANNILKTEWFWNFFLFVSNLPVIRVIPDKIIGSVPIPFIIYGVFGTAQYYIWGLIISKILLFLRK